MKSNVIIEQILTTSNAEIFQLQLRQEVEKPVDANPLAFFLEGYEGLGDNIERRVAFQTVSSAFITKYDLAEGDDLGEKLGKECQLVVEETFTQRTWDNKDGSKGEQSPKMNPSTGEILTKNGRPIYRNCKVSFDMDEVCAYIEHDKVSQTVSASTTVEPTADLQF